MTSLLSCELNQCCQITTGPLPLFQSCFDDVSLVVVIGFAVLDDAGIGVARDEEERPEKRLVSVGLVEGSP